MTLELGGKSPVLVFPDADLDRAARGIGQGIFGNAGQMCWAASRLAVHESIRDALMERLKKIAEATKLGPGLEEGAEMGPVVSREQEARVLEFIETARQDGGKVVAGGGKASDPRLAAGNFVLPTVVADLPAASRVVREEIFGPVLAAVSFSDADDAVRIANDTTYGLFASVWTRDLAHGTHDRSAAGSGHGLCERASDHLPADAVRRVQAERGRVRAGAPGGGELHPAKERPRQPRRPEAQGVDRAGHPPYRSGHSPPERAAGGHRSHLVRTKPQKPPRSLDRAHGHGRTRLLGELPGTAERPCARAPRSAASAARARPFPRRSSPAPPRPFGAASE